RCPSLLPGLYWSTPAPPPLRSAPPASPGTDVIRTYVRSARALGREHEERRRAAVHLDAVDRHDALARSSALAEEALDRSLTVTVDLDGDVTVRAPICVLAPTDLIDRPR